MMQVDLARIGAAEAVAEIRAGNLTSEALVCACMDRIVALDPRIRAFTDILQPELALAQARELDRMPTPIGTLHGLPVAVKEIFDVDGLRCAWGSSIHRDRVPQGDAVVVKAMRAAGAVIIGTTVSTEYAIAAAGPTANPYDVQRTPGGSSSGSAAAVAAHMVPLALGSQTIGSIVRPATYCGVYGLKPTHGAISTAGVMPLSPFLDDVGVLARTVDDLVLACSVLLGGAFSGQTPDVVAKLQPGELRRPARVIVFEHPAGSNLEWASRDALERASTAFANAGVEVLAVETPTQFRDVDDWLQTILCRDMAVVHWGDRQRAGDQMSDRLRGLIDAGRRIDDAIYQEAVRRALAYRAWVLQLLGNNAIGLAPATDGVAPLRYQGTGSPRLQGVHSLAGLAALAVPCGFAEDLPIGIQLIGGPGAEPLLLGGAQLI